MSAFALAHPWMTFFLVFAAISAVETVLINWVARK